MVENWPQGLSTSHKARMKFWQGTKNNFGFSEVVVIQETLSRIEWKRLDSIVSNPGDLDQWSVCSHSRRWLLTKLVILYFVDFNKRLTPLLFTSKRTIRLVICFSIKWKMPFLGKFPLNGLFNFQVYAFLGDIN